MSVAAKLAVGMMRAAYAPIKLFPQKNKIAILSRQSKQKPEDIRALEDYLREKHPELELTVLVKMVGGIGYAFHMLRQMHAIASSKTVVVDGYCIAASVLKHKTGTRIIQIWHSSAAIKKFGYQCLDKPSGHSSETARVMCMHRNYDYVICPSMATGRLFCQGFDTTEDRLRLFGLPRLEKMIEPEEEMVSHAKAEMKDEREIVLYVPTLRKVRPVELAPLAEAIDSDRYRLVVKLHPLDRILDEEGVDFGEEYSTGQWLKICDHVITDYSALGVEATLLNKPMYFYVYDIDRYQEETGININPLEEMEWCSSDRAEDIAHMIEGEYDFDRLRAFRDKYIEIDPENCTEKLAEFIVETVNGNN
ncbi:MAG: CDP-glycerol glycerophosphotransferase family protein [Bacillota bacterium]|nr:CDP-glycerol glycerophosphotransferase family protein [Bacillota bacterium]